MSIEPKLVSEIDYVVGFPQPAQWINNLKSFFVQGYLLKDTSTMVIGKIQESSNIKILEVQIPIDTDKKMDQEPIFDIYEIIYDWNYDKQMLKVKYLNTGEEVYKKDLDGVILSSEEFFPVIKNVYGEIIKILGI